MALPQRSTLHRTTTDGISIAQADKVIIVPPWSKSRLDRIGGRLLRLDVEVL